MSWGISSHIDQVLLEYSGLNTGHVNYERLSISKISLEDICEIQNIIGVNHVSTYLDVLYLCSYETENTRLTLVIGC